MAGYGGSEARAYSPTEKAAKVEAEREYIRTHDPDRMQPEPASSPVEECLRLLEGDCSRLTAVIDQLDLRLAPVLGEGNPHPSDDSPPAPGTSALVGRLMLAHALLDGEMNRLERMMRRAEVG